MFRFLTIKFVLERKLDLFLYVEDIKIKITYFYNRGKKRKTRIINVNQIFEKIDCFFFFFDQILKLLFSINNQIFQIFKQLLIKKYLLT